MASANGEAGGRPASSTWFRRHRGTDIAAILAVTALVYARSLGNGFVFDDHYWTNYPLVREWPFLWKSFVHDVWWFVDFRHLPYSQFYRPFQDAWMALNLHLFGLNPIGWHATMIGLHLIAVWLLYHVAKQITGDEMTAILAAALFALMPVHAEAIAWPSGIPEPLGATFEMGAFMLYLRAGTHRIRRIALSMGLLAGALLSHESAVVFPAVIAAYAFLLGSSSAGRSYSFGVRNAIVAAMPYALEVAVYLGVRSWVLHSGGPPIPRSYLPIGLVLVMAPFTMGIYGKLLAVPWLAGPAHPQIGPGSVASPELYLPLAGLFVAAAVATVALWRDPHRRLYLFCAALTLIPLVPILYVAPFDVQDRYLYLPSSGFCLMAADLAVSRGRGSGAIARAVRTGVIAMMILYAAVLVSVQHFWHDDVTLDRHCIATSPNWAFCHNLLAEALRQRGDLAGARDELETAVKLEPGNAAYVHGLGLLYGEIARTKDAAGNSKGADAELARAAALPGEVVNAMLIRAQLQVLHHDLAGAERTLREVLRNDAQNRSALFDLAMVMYSEHRYDDALAVFRSLSAIAPQAATYHYRIALTLHQLGRDQEAREQCAAALGRDPNDSNSRRLMTLLEHGGAPR
ncbi:MAG TPA: tetratricopeptide repeat protein [Candidatus Binataceae bacterium]|nr:tetratricopeptide repeat protein [Candidatus Binataceae bacterium]